LPLTDYYAKYFAYELTRRCPPIGLLATSRSDIRSRKCIRLILANIPTWITPFSPACFSSRQVNHAGQFWVKITPEAGQFWMNVNSHHDHSLRVENLPRKPPEPGQQALDFDTEAR